MADGSIQSGDGHTWNNPLWLSSVNGASNLNSMQVQAGDVIKFEIFRTSNNGDFAGVELAIQVIPPQHVGPPTGATGAGIG